MRDKIACSLPQKAARLQTLEKKISILEKAVDLNPDNEELLLCLLKSYQGRDNIGSLMEKWQKVLVQHFDSVKLWKEFLLVQQGEFSQFKVSNIRKAYGHAIQALSSACNKLCRQGFQVSSLKSGDSSLIQLECGLVDVFINSSRFEWQTGHHELATGLFQAEIEYSLFCPSLLLSSHTKQKLFEHFWNSSGARVGEDGALGWCNWMELEEQNKINPMLVENLEEVQGGWSGWMDPLSKQSTTMDKHVELLVDENTVENSAIGDIPPNDVESLLKNLGIDVEAGSHTEAKDALTWKKWLQEELSRDAEQWMPIRNNSGNYGGLGLHCLEDSEKEQLSRVVLFEDVTDYLFSLCSEEARFSLVYQFIDFFGGKLSSWTCTNDANWMDKVLSLEFLDDLISEDLIVVSKALNRMGNSVLSEMTSLLESNVDCFSKSALVKFLRNAILLCLNAFPRNRRLEEALIANEERLMTNLSNSTSPTNPSRALAKALLKRDRQDLLLCGIYARSEASYGNIDIARKIFDMALSSANGLPEELVEHYPLLFLWYAEMELAACTSSSDTEQFLQRAVHILCCLGGNIKFIPFTSQPSSLHILRARQGFKEQVKNLSSAWARGDIKESSIALICSAFFVRALN
ncbi:hypothetical protein HPP92_002422 [Vanilla planifolia]|uniref:Uncharacterized protein n=1 Tax=Vanilla planifolia TaxID=51239 RepID=A0A835S8H8_VANPL|nr:hypothetical protein HPP92_002422 [Vanilla planifolia]